jgi:Uncharacterised nucleotidyltransferase
MKSAESLPAVVPVYEEMLKRDWDWAMDEGDRHFQGEDSVFKTLRKIAGRLEAIGVPYAVVGGMALQAHGFRRLTVDVDILVTREDLSAIHAKLEGLGYVPPFAGSKNLRDAEHGVRVEFLIAGEFPGDGKPKPVAFPDPAEVGVEINGVRYLSLRSLVELKIASGMTNLGRLKDLADIQQLIQAAGLSADFANELNPYVREKYLELWHGVKDSPVGPVEPWPD